MTIETQVTNETECDNIIHSRSCFKLGDLEHSHQNQIIRIAQGA